MKACINNAPGLDPLRCASSKWTTSPSLAAMPKNLASPLLPVISVADSSSLTRCPGRCLPFGEWTADGPVVEIAFDRSGHRRWQELCSPCGSAQRQKSSRSADGPERVVIPVTGPKPPKTTVWPPVGVTRATSSHAKRRLPSPRPVLPRLPRCRHRCTVGWSDSRIVCYGSFRSHQRRA